MDSALTAVRPQSLEKQAYEALSEAVIRGRLEPGTRLVETEISARLGISRGPIREAIRRLESEGLVTTIPRRGSYVIDPTGDDVRELYSVRAVLEGFAVASVIGQLRERVLDDLHSGIDGLIEAADDGDWMRVAVLDSEWHEPLVAAAGNERLINIWRTVNGPLLALFAQAGSEVYAPGDIRRRHEELLGNLRDGEPAQVEQAVRDHYMDTAGRFAERLALTKGTTTEPTGTGKEGPTDAGN